MVSFDSVYNLQLPRVPLTDAHRRVDRIREQLVAARTHVPIHFQEPGTARSNPYGHPLTLRIQPNPADLNATATERQVQS